MIRRTVRFMLAASVLALALPAALQAQATVKLTKHNLSKGSRTALPAIGLGAVADYGEVCVYCHTPHSGSVTTPLWNRADNTGYTMYTSTNSATIDMSVGTAPGAVSLACASCHDGTVGLDVIINKPNASSATPVAGATMGTVFSGTKAVLGKDLRDDHPIAVTYDPTKDTDFAASTVLTAAKLPLYGPSKNQLECSTCHNPHNNTNAPFLRKANTNSDLCLTCHIK